MSVAGHRLLLLGGKVRNRQVHLQVFGVSMYNVDHQFLSAFVPKKMYSKKQGLWNTLFKLECMCKCLPDSADVLRTKRRQQNANVNFLGLATRVSFPKHETTL